MTTQVKLSIATWNINSNPTDCYTLSEPPKEKRSSIPQKPQKTETSKQTSSTNPPSEAEKQRLWDIETKARYALLEQKFLPAIFAFQQVGLILDTASTQTTEATFKDYQDKKADRPIIDVFKKKSYQFCGVEKSKTMIAIDKTIFSEIKDVSFVEKNASSTNPPSGNTDSGLPVAAFSAIHNETGEQVVGINVCLPAVEYSQYVKELTLNKPSEVAQKNIIPTNKLVEAITARLPSLCAGLKGRVTVIMMGDFNTTFQTPVACERLQGLVKQGFEAVGEASDKNPSHYQKKLDKKSFVFWSPDFIFLSRINNRSYFQAALDAVQSLFFSSVLGVKKNSTATLSNYFPVKQEASFAWDVEHNPSNHNPVFAEVVIEMQPSLFWRVFTRIRNQFESWFKQSSAQTK